MTDPSSKEPAEQPEVSHGLRDWLVAVEAICAAVFLFPIATVRTFVQCLRNPRELVELAEDPKKLFERRMISPFAFWVGTMIWFWLLFEVEWLFWTIRAYSWLDVGNSVRKVSAVLETRRAALLVFAYFPAFLLGTLAASPRVGTESRRGWDSIFRGQLWVGVSLVVLQTLSYCWAAKIGRNKSSHIPVADWIGSFSVPLSSLCFLSLIAISLPRSLSPRRAGALSVNFLTLATYSTTMAAWPIFAGVLAVENLGVDEAASWLIWVGIASTLLYFRVWVRGYSNEKDLVSWTDGWISLAGGLGLSFAAMLFLWLTNNAPGPGKATFLRGYVGHDSSGKLFFKECDLGGRFEFALRGPDIVADSLETVEPFPRLFDLVPREKEEGSWVPPKEHACLTPDLGPTELNQRLWSERVADASRRGFEVDRFLYVEGWGELLGDPLTESEREKTRFHCLSRVEDDLPRIENRKLRENDPRKQCRIY